MIYEFCGEWYCESCAPRTSRVLLIERRHSACANCGEAIHNDGEEISIVCSECGGAMDLVASEGDRMALQCDSCGRRLEYYVPDEDDYDEEL